MRRVVPEPTLSVVICTVDRPVLLRRSIDAIAAQDLDAPIETIVVFDRTQPDETLRSDDARRPVRVIANDRTPGLPGGRNAGASVARAPFLAFCDDDDVWMPDKARRQLAVLEADPAIDVVVTGVEIETPEHAIPRPLEAAQVTFEDLLVSRVMQANFCTAMVRRAAFEDRIGGADEAIPGGHGEDYEWGLRAARGAPLAVVPDPLIRIDWHGQSFFADRWSQIAAATEYLIDRFPEFARHRRGNARLHGQLAFARAAAGERRAAWTEVGRTLRLAPTEARGWLAAAVAAHLARPTTIVRVLNRRGRGI
jgi:glycosyltransferase involved in cell wall biosynthesis